MMTVEEIQKEYAKLDRELQIALITFERKDTIEKIRLKMLALQKQCPHCYVGVAEDATVFSNHNKCPYCGAAIGGY